MAYHQFADPHRGDVVAEVEALAEKLSIQSDVIRAEALRARLAEFQRSTSDERHYAVLLLVCRLAGTGEDRTGGGVASPPRGVSRAAAFAPPPPDRAREADEEEDDEDDWLADFHGDGESALASDSEEDGWTSGTDGRSEEGGEEEVDDRAAFEEARDDDEDDAWDVPDHPAPDGAADGYGSSSDGSSSLASSSPSLAPRRDPAAEHRRLMLFMSLPALYSGGGDDAAAAGGRQVPRDGGLASRMGAGVCLGGSELLHEAMHMLRGHATPLFERHGAVVVPRHDARVPGLGPASSSSLLARLVGLADTRAALERFAAGRDRAGPVVQSFRGAVAACVRALDAHLLGFGGGTLLALDHHVRAHASRLAVARAAVSRAGRSPAPAMLSRLHDAFEAEALVGGPGARVTLGLFASALVPLARALDRWLYSASLADACGEFFVASAGGGGADAARLWELRYRVVPEAVPSFVPTALAARVLLAGKSLEALLAIDPAEAALDQSGDSIEAVLSAALLDALDGCVGDETTEDAGKAEKGGDSPVPAPATGPSVERAAAGELARVDAGMSTSVGEAWEAAVAQRAGAGARDLRAPRAAHPALRAELQRRLDALLATEGAPPQVPAGPFLERSLLGPLRARCDAVGARLIGRLHDRCDLRGLFAAYRELYLAGNGELLLRFTEPLFERLPSLHLEEERAHSGHLLTDMLRDALGRSPRCRAHLQANTTVRVDEGVHGVPWRSVAVIGCLAVESSVPWPLSIAVSPESAALYRRLFVFLLQVRYGRSALDRVARVRHMCSHLHRAGRPRSAFEDLRRAAVATHRLLALLRRELVHFVSGFGDYATLRVVVPAWNEFERRLDEVTSVDALRAAHDTYTATLVAQTLLYDNADAARRRVVAVLDLCLALERLCEEELFPAVSAVLDSRDDASPDPALFARLEAVNGRLRELRAKFGEHARFLLIVLEQITAQGLYPHLEDLLSRLNFTHFYVS